MLFRSHLATGIHLHDDALPALRGLRDRGVPTVLVSNCSHGTRDLVERLGLVTEMDAIVLSYEIGSMKPSPDIYLAGLEALDATLAAAGPYDRALVLGDLVGYGADPNAVIDRVRAMPDAVLIRGNHDKVGAGLEDRKSTRLNSSH